MKVRLPVVHRALGWLGALGALVAEGADIAKKQLEEHETTRQATEHQAEQDLAAELPQKTT